MLSKCVPQHVSFEPIDSITPPTIVGGGEMEFLLFLLCRAKRSEAMRSDAKRCDAMRCDAMRCDVKRSECGILYVVFSSKTLSSVLFHKAARLLFSSLLFHKTTHLRTALSAAGVMSASSAVKITPSMTLFPPSSSGSRGRSGRPIVS